MESLSAEGEKAEILVAETNNFKTGGEDVYQKIGEAEISAETYTFDPDGLNPFYKILLKGPNNYVNVWVQ